MAVLKPSPTMCSGVAVAALLAALVAGCFSPRQPPCAFSCATPPHSCPSQYACADDGFCHRDDDSGTCMFGVDAGAVTNAPGDGAMDGGSAE
jgi:hypothetical protein